MVTKIQPPAEKIMNTLIYNELKMSGPEGVLSDEDLDMYEDAEETGHILVTRNVPEVSSLENEFSRLRLLNKRTTRGRTLTNPGFHMSVNPSDTEINTNEDVIVAFVDELMDRLGYKDVPYRVYKHTDIKRTHYHVIATRIGQDGKKINDSYENRRCNAITEELCRKYGFSLGDRTNSIDETEAEIMTAEGPTAEQPVTIRQEDPTGSAESPANQPTEERQSAHIVMPFKHGQAGVDQQIKDIHEDAMKWNFSTPEQYVAILKFRYNLTADIIGEHLSFQGLDANGNPSHSPRPEGELGLNALSEVIDKCQNARMRKLKNQRKRIMKAAEECVEKAETWKDFKKLMSKKGIYTVLSWSDNDEVFGVTWLDRATKCAFKGSETEATIDWLKQKAAEKGWKITRDRRYEKKPQSESQIMSRARIRRASTKEGLLGLANIKAVGHTHGTSTSAAYNRDKLKKEGEEERNDIIL